MQQPTDPKRAGWGRHAPLAVILTVAVIGYVTLRDYITFDTLRDNREALLAFRDANFGLMALAFITVYFVDRGLLAARRGGVVGHGRVPVRAGRGHRVQRDRGLARGVRHLSGGAVGLGQTLAARIETSEGKLKRLKAALHDNEISVLFLIRLVPAVPFFVANLLPALVGVRFFNFAHDHGARDHPRRAGVSPGSAWGWARCSTGATAPTSRFCGSRRSSGRSSGWPRSRRCPS